MVDSRNTKKNLKEEVKILERKIKQLESQLVNEDSQLLTDKFNLEFFAQMSHELRTPVNIILNTVDLLKEDYLQDEDEHSNELISVLNSACKRIHRTIESVLHITEIHSGTYNYMPVTFDLYLDLKEALYKDFKLRAEEKDLDFSWTNKSDDTQIIADAYSVTQIFFHVFENAFKFTNFGSIDITISSRKKSHVVSVKDTGIGISDTFIQHIFTPFTQEDRGYARKFEGNGLGLALVKKYCELNSAEIKVKSRKGEGSCFMIEFPKKSTLMAK